MVQNQKQAAEEIAQSTEYIEFEQKHNRHLNMMSENVTWLSHCNKQPNPGRSNDKFMSNPIFVFLGSKFASSSFKRIQEGGR